MARAHMSTSLTNDSGLPLAPHRGRIDSATVLGFASGFGLVAVAMTVGGSPCGGTPWRWSRTTQWPVWGWETGAPSIPGTTAEI